MSNMENKQIIICVGIPGAGKTTFSKKWVAEDPQNRYRFNNDELLNMMTDGVFTKEAYYAIRDMQTGFIKGVVSQGKSGVLDNTHMNPSVLRNMLLFLDMEIDEYTDEQYDIIIKDFTDVSFDECSKRNALRQNSVGENFLLKMKDCIPEVKKIMEEYERAGAVKIEKYDD